MYLSGLLICEMRSLRARAPMLDPFSPSPQLTPVFQATLTVLELLHLVFFWTVV